MICTKAKPYLETLSKLHDVVTSCLGQKLELDSQGNSVYQHQISQFSVAYRALNITVPLKVNIDHLNHIKMLNSFALYHCLFKVNFTVVKLKLVVTFEYLANIHFC